MAGVRVLLVLFLAVIPAYATDYTVGDSQGWSTGVDYSTWVSGKTFKVNDNLVFQYGGLHSVDEVSQSDYSSCSTSNSISSYNSGNNKIALTTAGTHYFICGTPGHCGQGMKLAVTVAGSSPSTPTTPSTPSTPSTPGSPSTPSSPTTPTPSNNKSGAAGNGFHGAMLVGSLLLGLGLMG